jgi:uncharacterized Rmd1/YagE family protein
MNSKLFDEQTTIQARALYVGHRLDLRSLAAAHRLATSPLVITEGQQGCTALFRYGVVVLFGLTPVEEMNFLKGLSPLISEPLKEHEIETAELVLSDTQREGAEGSHILLNEFNVERIQLVAEVLANSVVLSRYEANISASFDRIEPLAAVLQKRGKGGNKARELVRHIGDNLVIQSKMVGRAEIMEKPELLWEHPELERLYHRLEDEYELSERHMALERKLDLLSRTAETLLGLLNTKRSLRVEWYIVILIVFDILLGLYKMNFGS